MASKTIQSRWCSWCGKKTDHAWQEKKKYTCSACGKATTPCIQCDNMARAGGAERLCSVHDYSILSFEKQAAKIAQLEDWKNLFDGDERGPILPDHHLRDGFSIERKHTGRADRPVVLFINGWLSDDVKTETWEAACLTRFAENDWYHVRWPSGMMKWLAVKAIGAEVLSIPILAILLKGASRRGQVAGTSMAILPALAVIRGKWGQAMRRARSAGKLLASILAKTPDREFVLMGHSLGTSVIINALGILSAQGKTIIREVYLLGGAANTPQDGAKAREVWMNSLRCVRGKVYNCWCDHDFILNALYPASKEFRHCAIGIAPMNLPPGVLDVDVSDLVPSGKWNPLKIREFVKKLREHEHYKDNFSAMLDRIESGNLSPRKDPVGRLVKLAVEGMGNG